MAPRDITNCVRRPAPTKQITPTAPRRAVTKAPADDCALTAIVTPDGRTSAWRGDPATHLPEEVFHLVLALAGGRACVGRRHHQIVTTQRFSGGQIERQLAR